MFKDYITKEQRLKKEKFFVLPSLKETIFIILFFFVLGFLGYIKDFSHDSKTWLQQDWVEIREVEETRVI